MVLGNKPNETPRELYLELDNFSSVLKIGKHMAVSVFWRFRASPTHGIAARKRYCPDDSLQRFRAAFPISMMPCEICC